MLIPRLLLTQDLRTSQGCHIAAQPHSRGPDDAALDRTDDDSARDVAWALELRGNLPAGVQGAIHHGHVTLTGTVPYLFQHTAAENAIRHIRGVLDVINRIEVVPLASATNVRKRITAALHRHADIDARKISVTVFGSVATLAGEVDTWSEREAAERAAIGAPGISRVENRIEVVPPEW